MSEHRPPKDDAAMADILASIRRIVREEEQRVAATAAAPPGPQGDVLELTPEMRVDIDAPAAQEAATDAPAAPVAATVAAPVAAPLVAAAPEPDGETRAAADADAPAVEAGPAAPSVGDVDYDVGDLPVDEAQIADIVRAVLREELSGPLGAQITRMIRDIAREEIARAFEEFAAEE
jgi:cell pole-organizing protein PopZ